MTLLFLDLETGGITTGTSILSITLSTFRYGSSRIFPISQLHLLVKPDDSIYKVNPEALIVNGIDLVEHNKDAITYSEASKLIANFLLKSKVEAGRRPTLAGHQVGFDLDFLFSEGLISKKTWNSYVDPRVLDTLAVAKFLVLMGLIPEKQSLSLKELALYFGIEIDFARLHSSDYDNELLAKVLFRLRNLALNPPTCKGEKNEKITNSTGLFSKHSKCTKECPRPKL